MAEYSFVSPSYDEIHNACVDFVNEIKRQNMEVGTIAGVARGGLVPAVILSHMLDVPLITFSYSSKAGKGDDKNHDNQLPTLENFEGTLLIVDDICDSGQTLNEVVFHFNRQQIQTRTAVLFYKVHDDQVMIPDLCWRKILPEAGWITFPFERGAKL